ncbi:MAG: NAD-dependent epimerase/dehydratase family protein, partial [Deltaproteobacteria bacterium]
MSWLVTGGAGFVGVNLVRLLATRGIRARVFDDLTHGRRED